MKNKYRWREMKDEKPKGGECIYWYVKSTKGKYHVVGLFVGIDMNKAPEHVNLYSFFDIGECSLPAESLMWRKMCKLPGEE